MNALSQAGRPLEFAVAEEYATQATLSSQPSETHAQALRTEVCGAKRYTSYHRAWQELTGHAAHPNVFMDPAVVLAAASTGYEMHVILAWLDGGRHGSRLVGAWALRRLRPSLHLPFGSLCTTVNRLTYSGTPVLDRALAEPALAAIIAAIAAHPLLPKLILANDVYAEGPVLRAFTSVLAARRSTAVVVERRRRAMLATVGDPEKLFLECRSPKRRSNDRRRLRRLAECGGAFRHHQSEADVLAAFELFLTLEISGWKGRAAAGGHAIRREPRLEAFARMMIGGLAACGAAEARSITIGQRTIASTIVLRSGNVAVGWKIAFDEAARTIGPGSLLVDEVARALIADDRIEFLDSGNRDEKGAHAALWADRQHVVDIVIDTREGGFRRAAFTASSERLTRRLRVLAARVRRLLLSTRAPDGTDAAQGDLPPS